MKKFFTKLTIYIVVVTLAFGVLPFSFSTSAQTLDEVAKQIKETDAQKKAREADLAKAQTLLRTLQNQSYSVSTDINVIKSQITDSENKIKEVTDQVNTLTNNIQQTQNELNAQKLLRESQIRDYFIDSYKNDPLESILSETSDFSNFQTLNAIQSYTINTKKKDLDDMSEKVLKLNQDKKQVEELKAQLEVQKTQLDQKKSELQSKLTAIAGNIGNTNSSVTKIKSELNGINSNLSFLNAKQQQLVAAELAKMAANTQVQQTPVKDGQYFFLGRGRDLIEGHGMGMSQWGMYGMAQNFGWKFDQMLTFYYPGTVIGDFNEPATIVVDGKTSGPIPFEDYIAGIGEVPNDWPAEAIKAQVVAARTYAMRMAKIGSDGNYHICGSDACQVYLGGTAKKQYADATKGKVILYNGSPIVAYYSASHRGCSSTLSTVWGSSNLPYIQSVKDDAYAYKDYKSNNPYNSSQLITTYNWQWRTNGYSLDDLSNILSKSSDTNVGKLQSISTEKDSCGRVAKITLVGSAGTKSMTGWYFRSTFNDITPYNDYIYSTEFSFFKK